MICMFRRRRRKSEPLAFTRSTPSKTTVPKVGSIRRRINRPSVLLPEPDSPTKPTVSPARISKDTSSTARTWPARRLPNGDSARSKILVRLRTSSRAINQPSQRLVPCTFHIREHGTTLLHWLSRNHGHRRQRRDHADGTRAAEVLMQKDARQKNRDSRIERTEYDRDVETSKLNRADKDHTAGYIKNTRDNRDGQHRHGQRA